MFATKKLVTSFLHLHFIFLSASALADQNHGIYADAHVEFAYSKDRYTSVRADVPNDRFHSFALHLREVDADDILTICEGSLSNCATNDGVQPYWYSEDGSLMLFSATTQVRKKKTASLGEILYEAFPACPVTNKDGSSSAIGGDCYELVKTLKDTTLSITYWIGPTSLHRSKAHAVKEATAILRSVRLK
jgi:hypothetical protein